MANRIELFYSAFLVNNVTTAYFNFIKSVLLVIFYNLSLTILKKPTEPKESMI